MTDWSDLAGLEALAPHTGPFPHAGFLRAWWHHRGRGELIPIRVADGALTLVVDGALAVLAGEAISRLISPIWLRRGAGVVFVALGVVYLLGRE